MDEVDLSQERSEREAPALLAANRRREGPTPNGRCHYCDEVVNDTDRWCSIGCRDQWQHEQNRAGATGRRLRP